MPRFRLDATTWTFSIEAAPHAAAHQAGDVGELEAADAFARELDDEHLLVRIGIDGGERLAVILVHGVGGIVAGIDDAVLDDEVEDEADVGLGGGAIGQPFGHASGSRFAGAAVAHEIESRKPHGRC